MLDYIEIEQFEDCWNLLIEYGVCTEEEAKLVCYINGWTMQSLLDILWVRTCFRNFEQLVDYYED